MQIPFERTDQRFFLSDGRCLGFAEYGDFQGSTVFYFHGLPSSRLEAAIWHTSALQHHVRLIAPDRPGMGLSTFDAHRRIGDYPSDIAELCAHLNIAEFAIIGVSGGGMYALACATRLDLLSGLKSIAVVAGIGPRDLPQSGMSWTQKLAYVAMDWVPENLVGWFWESLIGKAARNPDRSVLERLVKKSMQAAPKSDRAFADDEEMVLGMTEALRSAFEQGSRGYVKEASLTTSPWDLEFKKIGGVSVRLWYGEKDGLAPPAVGRALARMINRADCTVFVNEGHTAAVMKHQDEILQTIIDSLNLPSTK